MSVEGWDKWTPNLLAAYVQVPRAMATLSLLGSSWICFEILNDPKKRKHIQQRLLFGMALTDIISSITYIWGVAAFPVEMEKDLGLVQGAYGNTATCDIQGFFGQFVPSTAFYNGFLALYYLATIKYKWKDVSLKKMENIAHAVALIFPIVTGALCIHFEVFNPAYIHCWIYEYPYGCLHSDVECIRGGNESLVVGMGWGLYYVPVLIALTFGSYAMFEVHRTVKQTLRKSAAHKFESSVPEISLNENNANSVQPVVKRNKKKEKESQLSKRVATQGLCYFFSFVLTWFLPFLTTILENNSIDNIPVLYGLAITLPLQGFMNWVVYMRPRAVAYLNKRRLNASSMLQETAAKSNNTTDNKTSGADATNKNNTSMLPTNN